MNFSRAKVMTVDHCYAAQFLGQFFFEIYKPVEIVSRIGGKLQDQLLSHRGFVGDQFATIAGASWLSSHGSSARKAS